MVLNTLVPHRRLIDILATTNIVNSNQGQHSYGMNHTSTTTKVANILIVGPYVVTTNRHAVVTLYKNAAH